MRTLARLLALLLASVVAAKPSFVVVLCDDLGYGDLGCYGNEVVQTPNVDRLAAQGLRLTHCYSAAPNCSPARTGLMTGRTPWRVGIHNWIPYESPMHVKASEITVATLLAKAGYDTCLSGKWHLNGGLERTDQPQPDDHGFKHWFATQNNALPNHRNPNNFIRNGEPAGPLEGYAADVVTDEAVRWLTGMRDKSKPFLLFVSYHEPHEPIASAEVHQRPYASKKDPAERAYWGNVTQMDAALGRLMATLREENLEKDTFVFFTSDNGPAITGRHPYGSTGPFRAKKGHVYEGGIRVPGLVRWPGRIEAGAVSDIPVSGVDVLPTLCELAAVDKPADRVLDGTSIVPVFAGKPVARERPLYWHFHRAKSGVKVAMRRGPWKILAKVTGPQWTRGADITAAEIRAYKEAGLTGFELYHLVDDPGEARDRKAEDVAVFERLRGELQDRYLEVRAESPSWPEWTWPKYEGQRIEWPEYRPLIRPPK